MKAVPEFLLASLIESDYLLNPYLGIETQLEKKASYMQSRVDKLLQYNKDADAGIALTKSQDEARSKLDEVVKHQEYVKHLITMVHRDHLAFDKALKAADIVLTNKMASLRSKAVSQGHVYGELLKQLANPSSTQAFLTGSNGALRLTANDLHALLRLRWAFSPSFEEYSSIEDLEKRTTEAADVVAAILSETSTVVDVQTGLQGKDAHALLESIKNSKFFTEGRFLWSNENSKNLDTALTDSFEKEAPPPIDSSLSSATEEADRSYEETPNVLPARGNECVDFSDHEDFKCLVNSVAEEVPSEKPTSASVPASDSTYENIESTNGSDSGNGTVTPSSDIHVAPPKMTKSNRGGKQFFKYRASNYPKRVQDKVSSQSGNTEDRIPRNGNSTKASVEAQQRRRDERQSRRGARSNGFISSNWNENDQRPRNTRSSGGRASGQPAASFHYEPGIGRRPAPTTCGFIFGGRA